MKNTTRKNTIRKNETNRNMNRNNHCQNSQPYMCSLPLHQHRHETCSSQRCLLHSHSLVCTKNHLFILGIGPICDKELYFIFRSYQSGHKFVLC